MNNKDILYLIALQIHDHATWRAFAMANTKTAAVARRLAEQKNEELGIIVYYRENIGDIIIKNVTIEPNVDYINKLSSDFLQIWQELNTRYTKP